jgi:hypothetical protein
LHLNDYQFNIICVWHDVHRSTLRDFNTENWPEAQYEAPLLMSTYLCCIWSIERERERERVDWYEAFCTKKQVHEGGNWSSDQQSSPYLPSTEATVCW